MSLECLAILGSENEPVYLWDPQSASSPREGEEKESGPVDAFGFSECAHNQVSIQHEFMMHTALDRLEEILGSKKNFSLARSQRRSHWLGSIGLLEEGELYGYLTTTNVKILALIQRGDIIPLQKRDDADIKQLFVNVHDCYVKHIMNPFSKIRSKIERPCNGFDQGIESAIEKYIKFLRPDPEETGLSVE